ncbi:TetR/AcrR family transcriptional regulator [Croceicoccus mobilis]|uniref:HTH-type transcriptional regulator YdeS n=1 Tax=Croceicoccus mobilis TaxID=1703339 RepID=A0A916Z1P4_9SPHN|nr:TetR/AcrR family transcriptional regulator [Croceicoccus mobilis]GGD72010.1 putative HTH-type transcriptional regulator YdeS [Croceicoccus mobilis]
MNDEAEAESGVDAGDAVTPPATAPGRPRDEEASGRIRAAALKLVREEGYGQVSISRIAKEAGAARQTLYNRWPTKAELVLDAFFAQANAIAARPDPAPDVPRSIVLRDFLCDIFAHLQRDGAALRSLIAAAQQDEDFCAIFRTRFVEPRGHIVEELLRDAQKRGELGAGRDTAMLTALVHGAFWYRLLNGQALDDRLAQGIVAEIFGG